jgi:hypothetical protein
VCNTIFGWIFNHFFMRIKENNGLYLVRPQRVVLVGHRSSLVTATPIAGSSCERATCFSERISSAVHQIFIGSQNALESVCRED